MLAARRWFRPLYDCPGGDRARHRRRRDLEHDRGRPGRGPFRQRGHVPQLGGGWALRSRSHLGPDWLREAL